MKIKQLGKELFEQITKIVHENKEHQDACERDKMINLVEAEQEAIIERHKKLIPDKFLRSQCNDIMLVSLTVTLPNNVTKIKQTLHPHYKETEDYVILTTESDSVFVSGESSKWRYEKHNDEHKIPKHIIYSVYVWYTDKSFQSKEIEFINSEYNPEKKVE